MRKGRSEPDSAKTYRYIKIGTNHYSLAFTYDWIASERERRRSGGLAFTFGETIMGPALAQHARNEGMEWPLRFRRREF